ncbi:MAG TPA: HIT domain-containing protein [Chloroflexota bacterium]|nr:HIT domain-containing protein [Chloroflexota bacterium]HUM67309.1 HIT domain-containing protein [Chloroflexota bacterium]
MKEDNPEYFVCRKHRGQISIPGGAIFEDEVLYVGHVQLPEGKAGAYLGHLMVEPKRHAPGLDDLTDREAQALGLMVTRLSRALKVSEGAEHVYALVLGDHVAHPHIHLVPRYPGAPREYWGVRVDEWPDAPRGGAGEITALCVRLRDALQMG